MPFPCHPIGNESIALPEQCECGHLEISPTITEHEVASDSPRSDKQEEKLADVIRVAPHVRGVDIQQFVGQAVRVSDEELTPELPAVIARRGSHRLPSDGWAYQGEPHQPEGERRVTNDPRRRTGDDDTTDTSRLFECEDRGPVPADRIREEVALRDSESVKDLGEEQPQVGVQINASIRERVCQAMTRPIHGDRPM